MDSAKYIGLDVHRESISIAVLECVIETKASTVLQFLRSLRGDLHVTFEEGTSAAWLYDLVQPHVTEVVMCDPRQNALLHHGNRSDRGTRSSSANFRALLMEGLGDYVNGAIDFTRLSDSETTHHGAGSNR
jgi:hypothetical protein